MRITPAVIRTPGSWSLRRDRATMPRPTMLRLLAVQLVVPALASATVGTWKRTRCGPPVSPVMCVARAPHPVLLPSPHPDSLTSPPRAEQRHRRPDHQMGRHRLGRRGARCARPGAAAAARVPAAAARARGHRQPAKVTNIAARRCRCPRRYHAVDPARVRFAAGRTSTGCGSGSPRRKPAANW